MIDSARPEFGELSELIRKVGKEIKLGKDLGTSLLLMAGQVRSNMLMRTMKIIKESLKAGGETTILLEEIAETIKKTAACPGKDKRKHT